MTTNNRVYYASQAVQVRPLNGDGSSIFSYWYHPLAIQSVGMTTNFATEQTFQLGTVELYDNVETVPNVEVTMSKIIDSTAPLYLMCMGGGAGITGANNKNLVSLSNNRTHFRLGIYNDNQQYIEDTAQSHVVCSGMYVSSFTYTFPVDGNATEEITLVGNHKVWNTGSLDRVQSGAFDVGDAFAPGKKISGGGVDITPSSSSGVLRRQYFNIVDSVLPTGSGGISVIGQNKPHIQNITISADLGREQINQLGKFGPYCRYATFPIEVTSEFEIIAQDGDGADANDFRNDVFCGSLKKNLVYKTIALSVCDAVSSNNNNSMTFDLGTKNTLTSVNYAGGDTGGGNATVTYSFRNFNNFTINASGSYAKGLALADTNNALNVQAVDGSVDSSINAVDSTNTDNTYGDYDNV